MIRTETHASLDRALDALASTPEIFSRRATTLARRWNRDGIRLEITDPADWRTQMVVARRGRLASIEEHLRAEIDSIAIMDRASEARLARRIEFTRIRFELALEAAGLEDQDVVRRVAYDPSTHTDVDTVSEELPPGLGQRWLELHALRRELVERNLYLVLINVERYAKYGVARLDLIQEGSAVLFRAVDGFDWRRGLLFRTYAVHWLNQAFRSYLYNHSHTVRVPVYLQKALKHIHSAVDRLGGHTPDVGSIAKEAGLRESVVAGALSASRSTISLDQCKGSSDDGGGPADWLCDEGAGEVYSEDMEDISLKQGLSEAMGRLSDRERRVIGLRFGIGHLREHTLSEVAKTMGVSLERIRQIQMRAIHKMRTPTLRKAISPFLQ